MMITQFMTRAHKDCDQFFVDFENIIDSGNWNEVTTHWGLFVDKLSHHFEMEETVLFPAFENATGMTQGPTAAMRAQHEQIRALLEEIEASIHDQDSEQCLGIAETLMIMTQQHNMTEEQILYPMTDSHTEAAKVLASMQAL